MCLKPSMSASWSLTLIHVDSFFFFFFAMTTIVCTFEEALFFNHFEMGTELSIFNLVGCNLCLNVLKYRSNVSTPTRCPRKQQRHFVVWFVMFTVVSEHFFLCILIFLFVSSSCLTVYFPQPSFNPARVCVFVFACV